MKQLVIISGKGGTGKTVLSACFATLAQNKVMADCDVDASNLHLLLDPDIQEIHPFRAGKKAVLDPEKCNLCGSCIPVCRFMAISKQNEEIKIDSISCEGCQVCSYVCPVGAITMENNLSGEWYVSKTKYGPFVHARLGIAEENSGKLVTEVRKKSGEIAVKENLDFVIIDGPPGIGCPVIASLSGTNMALVVTEPTLSGIHDMERVIKVAEHFRTETAVCINKYDINLAHSCRIEKWCEERSIPVLGKIPFDEVVTEAVSQGMPLTEYVNNSLTREIKHIWLRICSLLEEKDRQE
jgi:MinD superfamily P-loop ATPase